MVNKKICLGLFVGMFLIVCSYSVIAAVAWVSPTGGSNHSSAITIRVSFVNAIDLTEPTAANSSLYYNNTLGISSSDTPIGWSQYNFSQSVFSGWTLENGGTELHNITAILDITAIGDNRFILFNITLGNATKIANSTSIFNITIDNTAPTIAFACSPTSLVIGGTTDCTCTGSALSNILTNSYGTQTTTTLNNANTYTETCTLTSYSGLSSTTTASYTVTSSSSNSGSVPLGGGITTATWTATNVIDDASFKAGVTKELAAKERIKVKVAGGTHYIGVKSVTANSAIIEISSEPVSITLTIGGEAKVDIDTDGTYDLYVKLNGIANNKADVTVKELSEAVPAGEDSVSTSGEIAGSESGGSWWTSFVDWLKGLFS